MSGYCLVTGATGGLGTELARVAAEAGFDLILSARNSEKLEALAQELRGSSGREVVVVAADLGQPGAAAALWAHASDGRDITLLVNNAGLGIHGPFQDPALAGAQSNVLAVNIVAATELMRAAASEMAAKGRGRILNVASSAAFMPGPSMATYHASKAYLLSLSEAAAMDLDGSGVTVTALCPGPTDTGFFAAGNAKGARALKVAPMADPGAIARAGFRATMAGKRVIVPGLLYKLITFGMRFTPRGLALRITRNYWRK